MDKENNGIISLLSSIISFDDKNKNEDEIKALRNLINLIEDYDDNSTKTNIYDFIEQMFKPEEKETPIWKLVSGNCDERIFVFDLIFDEIEDDKVVEMVEDVLSKRYKEILGIGRRGNNVCVNVICDDDIKLRLWYDSETDSISGFINGGNLSYFNPRTLKFEVTVPKDDFLKCTPNDVAKRVVEILSDIEKEDENQQETHFESDEKWKTFDDDFEYNKFSANNIMKREKEKDSILVEKCVDIIKYKIENGSYENIRNADGDLIGIEISLSKDSDSIYDMIKKNLTIKVMKNLCDSMGFSSANSVYGDASHITRYGDSPRSCTSDTFNLYY